MTGGDLGQSEDNGPNSDLRNQRQIAMTETSKQDNNNEMTVAQIVIVFVMIGVIAAGIPVILQSFGNYVTTAMESERAFAERLPTVEGAPTPEPTVAGPALTADYLQGQDLFSGQGCVGCHSLDGSELVGPTLQNIGERGANRVEGQDAEEYIYTSIVDPEAHHVEGFEDVQMPNNYQGLMSEDEIDALVEFLLEQ
jgi:cytochrome c551/c552